MSFNALDIVLDLAAYASLCYSHVKQVFKESFEFGILGERAVDAVFVFYSKLLSPLRNHHTIEHSDILCILWSVTLPCIIVSLRLVCFVAKCHVLRAEQFDFQLLDLIILGVKIDLEPSVLLLKVQDQVALLSALSLLLPDFFDNEGFVPIHFVNSLFDLFLFCFACAYASQQRLSI